MRLSDYVTHSPTHQISYAFHALPFDIFPVFHSAKHARPSKILTAFALKTAAVAISFALKVQNHQSDCLYKSMYSGICKCMYVCVLVCSVYFWFRAGTREESVENELPSSAYR